MEKCPICGKYSVAFDEYYKRNICLMSSCGWSELSSVKKTITDTLSVSVSNINCSEVATHIIPLDDQRISCQSTLNSKLNIR